MPESYKMTLLAIYITLHLLAVIFWFIKCDWTIKFKKPLITVHLILFISLMVDVFIINLRGVWLDRLLVVAFLLKASFIFALYRKTLSTWQIIYFGFFIYYPIVAAATYLIDRIMFIVVASPLLATLTIPEIKINTDKYELREVVGSITPVQLILVEKGHIIEKYLGASHDEQIKYKRITGLEIIRKVGDTTFALVRTGDTYYEIPFHK